MFRQIVWAVDFGEENVTALAAETRSGGEFRLLGHSQTPAQGSKGGEIVNTGDVTECLVKALRDVENSCGLKCEGVFFNFDDRALESCFPAGSKTLSGEGQIRPEDVEEAVAASLRLVSHFEKSIVYSHKIGFLIDGKDMVMDPLGVFGRQLDVRSHVLLARTQRIEKWKKVMERAGLKYNFPVLSILSSAHGVLGREERLEKRIVCDLGIDILNAVLFEHESLREYAGQMTGAMSSKEVAGWVCQAYKNFLGNEPGVCELILTGDLAEKEALTQHIQNTLSVSCRVASPTGLPPFDRPKDASAVGLLRVASESHGRKDHFARAQQNLISGLRQKATALAQEYF